MTLVRYATISAIALLAPTMAQASDIGTPNKQQLSKAYTGKAYSPYAKRSFPQRPLWGDNHLHTALSFDAAGFGNRVGLRDAYRLAPRRGDWKDPDFDPKQRAFYYTRVIEIPTPPWYVYDAFRLGSKIPNDAPTSQQERAYTTPIWYTPMG